VLAASIYGLSLCDISDCIDESMSANDIFIFIHQMAVLLQCADYLKLINNNKRCGIDVDLKFHLACVTI